jgi:hypothetical protein
MCVPAGWRVLWHAYTADSPSPVSAPPTELTTRFNRKRNSKIVHQIQHLWQKEQQTTKYRQHDLTEPESHHPEHIPRRH